MAVKKRDVLDPKARAARQKKIAAVGGVLLLALLAYQVPKTLKLLHPKPIQHVHYAAAPATPGAATPVPTTPATPTGAPAAAASSNSDALVVNADLSPMPLDGQLTSFTLFTSKDPFQQQATTGSAAGTSSSSGSSGSSPKKRQGGSAVPQGSGSTPPAPAPVSAVLSVNGVEEPVNVNSDFPAAAPLFHLVSLTATSAKLSIAGGSLASGAPTVTLHLGKPVTLMNTADGTRYKLLLVSTSASAAATPAPASTSTSTTTTTTTG